MFIYKIEQIGALAKLNEVVVPIDIIFSHFFSSKNLDDKQKLNYILYFIRFSYVDVNVNNNYEKILSSDNFYYSKLLQLDVILRHFWQLSESIQQHLLNTSSSIDDSETKNRSGEEYASPNILYYYFNCIDKCPSDLIRHDLPLSDENDEISTLDKTIITTLSLLPHYIHYSLFSFWEKHYFTMLIQYENQIILTILVESWCNVFKYLDNDIQDLYSISSSQDICSTEVEQKLNLLNMLNMNDLYYRDEQTYKIALEIWENVLCPLLEHPDEKIALYAFKKCSLPIKAIQKYLDNNGILLLSSQEIKKLQDVSIVLLGNCKTAIQADLKEPIEEDEQMNAYL
ncbi:hypothetical protein PIROE2DRAFT_19305, partial [Piromyces sp. E2]